MSRYIDADAVIKKLDEQIQMPTFMDCLSAIYSAPSIDIEPKRGEWIRTERMGTFKLYDCSVCGIHIEAPWNFCPNCGADMREREGE